MISVLWVSHLPAQSLTWLCLHLFLNIYSLLPKHHNRIGNIANNGGNITYHMLLCV